MYALLWLVAAESRLYLIMLNMEAGSLSTGRVQAERVLLWCGLMGEFSLLRASRDSLQRGDRDPLHATIKQYFL